MSRSLNESKVQAAARLYLEMRHYHIIEQNWRLSRQQIDIVARKDETIYLVSVYYRPDDQKDVGIEVTATKQRQLQQAAEAWIAENKWRGRFQLAHIEIGDPNYAVISFADTLP